MKISVLRIMPRASPHKAIQRTPDYYAELWRKMSPRQRLRDLLHPQTVKTLTSFALRPNGREVPLKLQSEKEMVKCN